MSTYVVGDVHGCFNTLMELLEKVGFSEDEDILYVNGDIMDRGENFYELYQWISQRIGETVYMTLGNHELEFSVDALAKVNGAPWVEDPYGSIQYLREVKGVSDAAICDMCSFFDMLPLFYDITVGERRFIIVHAYVKSGVIECLEDADEYECTWDRALAVGEGWDDPVDGATIIFGHTPTLVEAYEPEDRGRIYRETGVSEDGKKYEKINIDCGCVWGDEGRLALLRLDDMQEFYQERIDDLLE